MSYRVFAQRSRAMLTTLAAAAALAVLAPAVAAAACPTQPSSNAFSRFGDEAAYTLAPGGSFEDGAPGWSLKGAAVARGNESFHIIPGSHSLAIAPSGSAVSPLVCVSSEYPSFRLFVRRVGANSDSSLNISLRWIDLLGATVNAPVASLKADEAWVPTPVLALGSSVPLWLPGSSLNIGLVFEATGSGSWAIDDVYIDPYSR
jgi:hypothetical protein